MDTRLMSSSTGTVEWKVVISLGGMTKGPQRFGTRDHRDDFALDGGVVEEDVDLGLVHLLDGRRPVVHLQEQVALPAP